METPEPIAPPSRFPLARRVWGLAEAARSNWMARHQNPFNFAIHMVGIPLTVLGLLMLPFLEWYWGVGAFVLGYVFQWIGHQVEGNDVGEMIPIKKALGLKTIAIVPRPTSKSPA